MTKRRFLTGALTATVLLAAGCSSGGDAIAEQAPTNDQAATPAESNTPVAADGAGIRLVSAEEGADIQANPPSDLVILDVRTPEEYAEGHLEGAMLIDFYEGDFADQLATLDPDVPYLLYCRSGNRSGQTAAIMSELGFTDVADVDGGIVEWIGAGHPVVDR